MSESVLVTNVSAYWEAIIGMPVVGTIAFFMFRGRSKMSRDIMDIHRELERHKLYAANNTYSKEDMDKALARIEASITALSDRLFEHHNP